MVISIVIADKNKEYLNRMSDLLQRYNELNISLFTNGEKLQAALEKNKYDIVLFDPDVSDVKLNFYNVKLPLCLYSDEAENTDLYPDTDKIRKYQRVSNIYKEINKRYSEVAGNVFPASGNGKTRLSAFYSPVGGSGKTAIALSVAALLAERDKKVLFVSLEQLAGSAALLPYKEEGITALLETISSEGNFEMKLKGVAKEGIYGVDYVEGFERIIDYRAVNMEEISTLLAKIRDCGVYSNVVVDLGSAFDDVVEAAFEQARDIVIVNAPGVLCAHKMAMFSRQAVVDEYRQKMCEIRNFADDVSAFDTGLSVPVLGTVPALTVANDSDLIGRIRKNRLIDVKGLL